MCETRPDTSRPGSEAGFALILALLSLVLLTLLGLTLATTTSTELQISTNYRYAQQALYNAEAGIELGKRYLRQTDWRAILPPARQGTEADMAEPPDALTNRPGPEGEPSRNFELCTDPVGDPESCCDSLGHIGYGVVLDDPNEMFPFQNSSYFLGETLNGTFTIWVRRKLNPSIADPNVPWVDEENDTSLILTAEGTAPFQQGSAASQFAIVNRAVRYLEVELERVDPNDCSYENRKDQVGMGPQGANFDNCDPIDTEITIGGNRWTDQGGE
jgi:hypothetical protein